MIEEDRITGKNTRMIVAVRIFHAVVALPLYAAIAFVWYSGLTGTVDFWFYLATGALVIEGVVVLANRGYCPIIYLHRKFGDEKRFFELFIPGRYAKYAFAVLGCVIVAGYVLVLLNSLY